ncbi:ribosomal RNA small subunit methyltransferase A [candidate division WS5 bacterium]|uniref:Ribosomal RNA small subunit methyltransferase A n=1 Tax=candidate division WS5 bacterium TaxID=2093353 RepID=A0A419DG61_9BACT|nr:MAG: ribosomal RNA small subunit methyltransferase A [candidate division WS5 bacterium]
MDLMNILELKKLLKTYGAWPNKDLGQHFLTDQNVLEKMVETADLKKSDIVVEVGPGLGIMTRELAKTAKKVYAVEIDPKIAEILSTICINCRNIDIIRGDIKQFNPKGIGRYKVVANLPYYITSHVIKKFLEEKNKPDTITVLVQREVAERICAKPGRMSVLALAVQFYGQPEIKELVSPMAFFPSPKVYSAILKIKVFKKPIFSDVDPGVFFRLVKAGFGEKRKMLINSMAGGLGIDKETTEKLLRGAGIEPMLRAERLSLDDWRRMYLVFTKYLNLKGAGNEAGSGQSDW